MSIDPRMTRRDAVFRCRLIRLPDRTEGMDEDTLSWLIQEQVSGALGEMVVEAREEHPTFEVRETVMTEVTITYQPSTDIVYPLFYEKRLLLTVIGISRIKRKSDEQPRLEFGDRPLQEEFERGW